MSSRRGSIVNADLRPLPSHAEIARAMLSELGGDPRARGGMNSNLIAQYLGVEKARRLGRGARGPQSWSGYMSGALRIAPRLRSMERAGLIYQWHPMSDPYRRNWSLTTKGSALAEGTDG